MHNKLCKEINLKEILQNTLKITTFTNILFMDVLPCIIVIYQGCLLQEQNRTKNNEFDLLTNTFLLSSSLHQDINPSTRAKPYSSGLL